MPFALKTTTNSTVTLTGLAPNAEYIVSIRALPLQARSEAWGPAWSTPSQGVPCKTLSKQRDAPQTSSSSIAAARIDNVQTMKVYRISEYSFSVDFLRNHDSASVEAMPLYLMTCADKHNCSPWDAQVQSPKWDSCHVAMDVLCPGSRGAAFNCMECADAHRDQLTAACGVWSDDDTLEGEGSFAVHWWCGVGWPESAPAQGPITEYTVEYQPLPGKTRMGEGFSDYLSCNSDEVDGTLGNDPRDPSCLCIVMDDRLLAHQTNASYLGQDCYVGGMAWIGETSCNCTGQTPQSPIPQNGNPSLTHVGRMPVWLPYVGVTLSPYKLGDPEIFSGYNYHFPVNGACEEGEAIGTRGCTWRRLPQARMIYGKDLIAEGWNTTFVRDTPTDLRHTEANKHAFKAALNALGALVKPL